MEQLNSILNSWTYYTPVSSITAVFFVLDAILLITFFSQTALTKKFFTAGKSTVILSFYGAVISLLILFPLTAILLRQFQTVFYPYVYLWLAVPVIPVTAAGLTILTFNLKQTLKKGMFVATVVLTCIILLLCGSIGNSDLKKDTDSLSDNRFSYSECLPFLERLDAISAMTDSDNKFTVLAPKEITEYIHMYSGNTATIYGRDLWDTGLAPYSYNQYPDEYYDLYTWETYEEKYGTFYYEDGGSAYYYTNIIPGLSGGEEYMDLAKRSGADAIIFFIGPDTDMQALEFMSNDRTTEIFYLNENEGYIIIYL